MGIGTRAARGCRLNATGSAEHEPRGGCRLNATGIGTLAARGCRLNATGIGTGAVRGCSLNATGSAEHGSERLEEKAATPNGNEHAEKGVASTLLGCKTVRLF